MATRIPADASAHRAVVVLTGPTSGGGTVTHSTYYGPYATHGAARGQATRRAKERERSNTPRGNGTTEPRAVTSHVESITGPWEVTTK